MVRLVAEKWVRPREVNDGGDQELAGTFFVVCGISAFEYRHALTRDVVSFAVDFVVRMLGDAPNVAVLPPPGGNSAVKQATAKWRTDVVVDVVQRQVVFCRHVSEN
jgi:hypothetical protein